MRGREVRLVVSDSAVEVFLYGATGYTGRLIAEELQRAGVSFRIGGRDGAKLRALAGDLGLEGPVVVAGVDDAAALESAARDASVVVSAAGPFVDLGQPVLEASVGAGSHYIDISGEQTWLRTLYGQTDRVHDAGITAVGAMGFDVVPSDIAAVVSTTAMRSVERLDVAVWTRTRTSRGTMRTMARMAGEGWWYDRGTFRRAIPGRRMRPFPFPEPLGDRLGVLVPWGDVVTAPRSTGAKRVRTFFCPGDKQASRMHRVWPLTAVAWRSPLARAAMSRRARTQADPTPEQRAKAEFRILAEAEDDEGVVQRGYVAGRDPYGLTAALVAYAARGLAQGSAPRGVCTPTQAFRFGPLAEAMAPRFGFEWRARSLMP